MGEGKIIRPHQVNIAITLFYVFIGIGALRSVLLAVMNPEKMSFTFFIIPIIGFILMLLIISSIGKGRNWVRIFLLLLLIVGGPSYMSQIMNTLSINPVLGYIDIINNMINIIAVVLLFLKPSSEWFKLKSARSQTS